MIHRQSMKLPMLAALLIIAILTLFCFVWTVYAGPGWKKSTTEDIQWVVQYSSEVMARTDLLVVKHSGVGQSVKTSEDLHRLAVDWSSLLDLPVQISEEFSKGKRMYKSARTVGEGQQISLHIVESRGMAYMTIESRWNRSPNAEEAASWQQQVDRLLREGGIRPQWSIAAQGMMRSELDRAAMQSDHPLLQAIKAAPVEYYSDARSESWTYQSDRLNLSVQSGDRAVQLQTAVHRLSDTGEHRVTVGVPLVTIEY